MRISDWSSDVCSSDLPDPDRGGQRAVDDRQRPRRATEQDRHGQRPVQRHLESRQQPAQATTAPPAKEKNDRKNEDAANAIDSPNTIWISRRNPPKSEEHTSELQSLMRISYAVFSLKKKKDKIMKSNTPPKSYNPIQ